MICTNCNKSFDNALDLYSGCIACPHCGAELAAVSEFKITQESEERFRLSETYFFRSLELSNAHITGATKADAKKLEAEWRSNIENAIKNCRIAANAGHPEAYWRMGFYYDKDYAGVGSTEAQRCRIAYNFYAALCYYDRFKELKVDGNASAIKYNNDMFVALRRKAANDLLIMLYNAPLDLARNERFDYAKNRERLIKLYDDGIGPSAKDRRDKEAIGASQSIITLSSCLGKTRVPLFGYFYVSPDELIKLTDTNLSHDAERINETIYPMLSKNVYMVYIPCRKENRAVGKESMEVYDSAEPLKRYHDSEKYAYGGYLCFVNCNGAHMPDKSLPKKVRRILFDDKKYTVFKDLINKQTVDGSAYFINGLTFYCDDVIKYKRMRPCTYSDAINELCADAVKISHKE